MNNAQPPLLNAENQKLMKELRHHQKLSPILAHFSFTHLPPHLMSYSRAFAVLAVSLAEHLHPHDEELQQCLRKLLEAKDCAVRSRLTLEMQISERERLEQEANEKDGD